MTLKKQVKWVLSAETDNVTEAELSDLLTGHVKRRHIGDDFEIEAADDELVVHFDVNEDEIDDPAIFLFSAFAAYGGTSYHRFN